MTDQTGTGIDDNDIEIDSQHPWAEASTHGGPQPVPVNVKVEPVTLGQGDEEAEAAMFTFVTPVGVFNFFVPPQALHSVLLQGGAIMRSWVEEQQSGIQVASVSDMRDAAKAQEAERMFRR